MFFITSNGEIGVYILDSSSFTGMYIYCWWTNTRLDKKIYIFLSVVFITAFQSMFDGKKLTGPFSH